MQLINEIDTKYRGVESQITKVVINDEKSLAFHVLKAVEKLSTFEFVKTEENIEDLNGVIKFLIDLIKEIDDINIPIARILKRTSVGQPQSLLENFFSSEKLDL